MLKYLVPAVAVFTLSACTDDSDSNTNRSDVSPATGVDQRAKPDYDNKTEVNDSTNRNQEKVSQPNTIDQPEAESDQKITQAIRQALAADSKLSAAAKNITITSVQGAVTLSGTVEGSAERQSVVRIAEEVSGVNRVTNKVDISQ